MSKKNVICTATHCKKAKKAARPFCPDCFAHLPLQIKDELIRALSGSSSRFYPDILREAREHIENKNNQYRDENMTSDTIEINLTLLEEREKSFKVTDGESDPGFNSPRWIFLPKSKCSCNGDGTFNVPEWLAKEKRLI